MTNYVIRLSSGRLIWDMCESVWEEERERERGGYTYEHKIKWGMTDYIKNCHQLIKIPIMRYIYNSCPRVHICE